MKKYNEDSIEGSVRLLEKELSIREGFLESLQEEDDWSFIIKLHALLEAAVSYLICKTLNHNELSDIFSFIELSNTRSGKIAFIKALDLLDKKDIRFIHSLSEIRNKLVHDITNVEFNLKSHMGSLSTKDFTAFVKNLDSFSVDDYVIRASGVKVSAVKLFKSEPKKAIWYSAMVTVSIIYQSKEIARLKQEEVILKEAINLRKIKT